MTARNCLTCFYRGPARTPQINADPQYAATCEYPLPKAFCGMSFNDTDAKRHINLATITPGSEGFNASHAQIDCPVHQPAGSAS